MIIHPGIAAAGPLPGAALTIGNFDGVHRGHRALVDRTRALAARTGGPSAVLTFWPHPARMLAPDRAPPLVCTRQRRRELLAEAGVDVLLEQPFDAPFAATPAEEFERMILDGLGVRAVVVGWDFTYGRGRGGDVRSLGEACARRVARLDVVAPVTVDGLVASSTKVREFVLEGNVEGAAALLGRPFALEGPVVTGAGRGRTIGVPTANVAAEGELLPAMGVYAVRVLFADGSQTGGACNVGLNPTFRPEGEHGPVSVEVHVLDWTGDLRGSRLRLQFMRRLRPERRFPDAASLVTQIRADLEQARRALSEPPVPAAEPGNAGCS